MSNPLRQQAFLFWGVLTCKISKWNRSQFTTEITVSGNVHDIVSPLDVVLRCMCTTTNQLPARPASLHPPSRLGFKGIVTASRSSSSHEGRWVCVPSVMLCFLLDDNVGLSPQQRVLLLASDAISLPLFVCLDRILLSVWLTWRHEFFARRNKSLCTHAPSTLIQLSWLLTLWEFAVTSSRRTPGRELATSITTAVMTRSPNQ